jgi:hypothetical protein
VADEAAAVTSPSTLEAPPATRRWTPGRIVVLLLIASMVAMWVYVLYLAFGPGRQDPPDRLSNPAFATAAQARCDEAHAQVDQLPTANQAPDAAAQADIVDQANAAFASMLDDLEAIVPPGEDGQLAQAWLDDWRTYLGDRERYADALRTDPEARLLVTPKDREQITEFLDAFAADNQMIACGTPLDVG